LIWFWCSISILSSYFKRCLLHSRIWLWVKQSIGFCPLNYAKPKFSKFPCNWIWALNYRVLIICSSMFVKMRLQGIWFLSFEILHSFEFTISNVIFSFVKFILWNWNPFCWILNSNINNDFVSFFVSSSR